MPHTKIIATLGPATESPTVLRQLLAAGVDVFRLNASHGSREQHADRIRAVRCLATEAGSCAAILLDLQGPKIRLGKFEGGGCILEEGSIFEITIEPVLANCHRASTNYSHFPQDVNCGDRVLLADGTIELNVIETDGTSVKCEVISGGPISDNKGINLPGVQVSAPALTDKDISDARFGLEAGVDLMALSFVRSPEDVRSLRRVLGDGIPIIAKIEKPQAWETINSILDEANGVMVARGDLGVEMALEKVPAIQKSIIRRARHRGKFVITATQMLESMIEHPTPTRAEVSDVANAIYDGTDAVMLSAETSTGKHPVEAVAMMARIAKESENSIRARGFQEPPRRPGGSSYAEIVADAAYHAARDSGACAIVVFTAGGSSARLVSKYRPPVPIYAITPHESVARQLSIHYGVSSVPAPEVASTDEMLTQMDRLLVEHWRLKAGDPVVFVAGQPIGRPGTTNLMKLHRIGELR